MLKRKAKSVLVVDGYNIINDWQGLRRDLETSLEEARNRLIHILAEYAHYSKTKILLVFDAYNVKGRVATEDHYQGVDIIYTEEHQTADQYIEKYLDRFGQEKRIRVATSDRVEQELILQRGGTRISARELEAEIHDAFRNAKRKQALVNSKNNYTMGTLPEDLKSQLEKWLDRETNKK